MHIITPTRWLNRFIRIGVTALFLCSMIFIASCDDDEEDKLPPEVSFADLSDGAEVWGIVPIELNAEDGGGIDKIDVFIDDVILTTITATPYEANWDTNEILEGNHTIKIVATDRAGNVTEISITVVVNNDEFNDSIAPALEITTPAANSTVWGTVNVTADVTDNRSISTVEFLADGTVFSTVTSAPFSADWSTGTLTDGEHIIKVIATDKANNKSEKQVTVVVKNTLITISVPADQLWNEGTWTENGYIFLNDNEGNLLASAEFQNGQQIELKSADFSGETFSLTQVSHSTNGERTRVNFWTYTNVSRGNWVLMKEIPDDEVYAGEATLTFTNPAAEATYLAVGNGDDSGYVDPFSNEVQSIRLQKSPSKLYVTRKFESGTPAPAYKLYSDIAVGANTIDLNQSFTPLTKFDYTLPADMLYMSVGYDGYADSEFTERYDLDYTSAVSGTLSVYKPAGAFAAYWSEIELETGDYNLFRTSTAEDPTSFELLSYQGEMNYADNKLIYNVTGDEIDFVSTSFYKETITLESYWAFVGPTSATGSITIPQVPEILNDIPRAVIDNNPAYFTIYDFANISNYDDFLTYVRNSTYGIDELYQDGMEAADMNIFQDVSSGGRSKKFKHRGLRTVKSHR